MDGDAQLTARLEVKINEALRQMDRFNNRADAGLNRFERRAQEASARVNASLSRIGQGSGLAKGLLAGAAGAFTIDGAKQLLDAATTVRNALKVAGLEGDKLEAVYTKLFASAQKNAVPIGAMADLYGKLAQSQKELGVSGDELLSFTDKIGVALRVSGKSASETSGALLQLSQSLGGGAGAAVRAEEFSSIMEGAPTIMQAAAAGIKEADGSVSKLRQMMIAGKLSAGALFHGFIAGSAEMEKKAAASETTISAAFVRLQNVLIDVAGRIDKGSGATNKMATALQDLATWIQNTDFQPAIDGAANFGNALVAVVRQIEDVAREAGHVLGTDQFGPYLKRKYGERQQAQPADPRYTAALDARKAELGRPPTEDEKRLNDLLAQRAKLLDDVATAQADIDTGRDTHVQQKILDAIGEELNKSKQQLAAIDDQIAATKRLTATKLQSEKAVAALNDIHDRRETNAITKRLALLEAKRRAAVKEANADRNEYVRNSGGNGVPFGRGVTGDALETLRKQAADSQQRLVDVNAEIAALKASQAQAAKPDADAPAGTQSDPIYTQSADGKVTLDQYPVTGGSGDAATSTAFALIEKMERFRANAYEDWTVRNGQRVMSGYRAGYGSGTYTDDSGNAVKVTASTSVTVKQATDDLNRRIGLYFAAISAAVGPEQFAALNADQKGVLASLAHNYGTLPDRIVAAVKTGDPRVAYDAIVKLGNDNGGINRGRRQDEADQYLNGAPAYVRKQVSDDQQAAEDKAKKVKDQADAYKDLIEQSGRFVSEQEAERAALGMSAEAAAKLRIQQELLNDAKQRDIELTPERLAGIEREAEAMAKAEAATKQAVVSRQDLADAQQFAYDQVGNSLIDVIMGAESAEEALQGVIKALAKAALQAVIMGDGPLAGIFGTGKSGGFLGGIFGAPITAATGGHIRGPGTDTSDSIPAMLSNGEHVTNARSARKYRRLLDLINTDKVPHFAAGTPALPGGMVAGMRSMPAMPAMPPLSRHGAGRRERIDIRLQDDSGRMAGIAKQEIQTASGPIVNLSVMQSGRQGHRAFPGRADYNAKRGV